MLDLEKRSRVLQMSIGLCLFSTSACGPSKADQNNPGQLTTGQGTASSEFGTNSDVPETGDAGDTDPAPTPGSLSLGEECKQDADCQSKICVEEKFEEQGTQVTFKMCSACRDDAQCIAENRGLACQYSFASGARDCVDGKLGSPCTVKAHCADNLMCALINMGDNKSVDRACSECAKHVDCPAEGKRNCVSRDKPAENGEFFNQCLEDGVRQTGEICFPCETGNRECAEGFCAKVELEDGLDDGFCIGVCGACHTDADCGNDSRCVPPELNFEGKGLAPHKGSMCVKKGR